MTLNSLDTLAKQTGLSPAEIQRRAEQLVDVKTGKIQALSALDAALVQAAGDLKVADPFSAAGAMSANPHTIEDPTQAYIHDEPMAGFAPEAPQPPSIGGPVAQLEKSAKSGASRMTGFCGGAAPYCAPPPPPPPVQSSPETPKAPPVNSAPEIPAAPVSQQAAPSATGQVVAPSSPSPSPVVAATPAAPKAMKKGFAGAGGAPVTAGPSASDTAAAGNQVDAMSRDIQFEMIKNEIQKMSQIQQAMSNTLTAMHEQAMTAIRNTKA